MALTQEELKAIQEQSVPFSPRSPTTPVPEGQEVPAGMTMYPTAQEKLEAVGLGTAQGVAKGSTFMGGAVGGMRAGAALSPALGPYAPVGPVAGAIIGGGLGLLGGEALDSLLFDEFAARQRPEVAPYREGGKTFGETISAAPWMFGLPTMTGNRVSRFISTIGDVARKNPLTFLAGETSAGALAGVAGGTTYAIDPEAKGLRFGAEITAGMLSPTRLLGGAVSTVRDAFKNASGATTAGGRQLLAENAAATQLQQILMEHGEDIPKLVRLLQKPLPSSVPTPTSAQKSGSLLLSEVERALGNMHVKFAADTDAQGKEALRAYALLVERLQEVGTPGALTQAAQLRSNLFDQMLNARLATADANAAQKIVKIRQDTPQSRAQIGEIVKAETSLALQNARMVESELWNEALRKVTSPVERQVTKKVPMEGPQAERIWERTGIWPDVSIKTTKLEAPQLTATNTFNAFLDRVSQIGSATYDTAVPKVVQSIMQDLGATKATVLAYKQGRNTQEFLDTGKVTLPPSYKPREVPVGELINYRSDLLALARDASARGEVSDASMYSNLAEALLTDLNQLKSPAFDAARDFSRALNDTFTRTFARTASIQGDVAKTGAERLPAEILVMRAFGQNADVTAQRMVQIEDAVRFMRTQYDEAVQKFGARSDQARMLKPLAELADQQVVSIQDAQTRIMRLLAAKTVDPLTGRVNPKQLQTFVEQNKTMLDRVGLTNDLTDAVKAELALKQVAAENSQLNRTLRNQTAFAQVLKGGENPTTAVLDVLNSRSPVLGMNRMVQLAKAGGAPAVNGLKSTLYDYAFTKAGGIDNFDPAAFRSALFSPLGPNKPSIVGMLRQHGVMEFGEMRAINELIRPMLQIEDAMANRQSVESVMQGTGAITDLALRIIGSKVGAGAAGHSGPGTLIAASAGSKAMRTIFDKMPAGMTRAVMEDAMRDPQLLSLLLQKPTSVQQQNQLARSVAARLVSSGVLPASMLNYIEKQPQEQPRTAPARTSAPPTRGVPTVPPVAPPATGPAAGKVSMGPDQQSLYQALFPQDSINALMSTQQPPAG